MIALRTTILLGVLAMAAVATGATVDLDRGSDAPSPNMPAVPTDRVDCYTIVAESIVTATGVGQACYESGPLDVVLVSGQFYGIGVGWQDATVTYLRDPASLPRAWDLGTVGDAMQISDPPPYTSLAYNHFTGAEYSMELGFQGPVATERITLGAIKALYR